MRIVVLQSGSNGNCFYVEAGGVRLLFDAGISARQAQLRLAVFDRRMAEVDALLISHDHRDHARGMGVYQRRFGLPIYSTERTLLSARSRMELGAMRDVRHFRAGDVLSIGGVKIETIPTPHDGADGVVFVVDDRRQRLGIMTDLGHVFDGLQDTLQSLDAVVLESNFDPWMLANGPYPERLQDRIRGPGGHLSNGESAQLLAAAEGKRLQWACLAHLSENNNTPDIALRTHRQVLGERLPLFLASRYAASDLLEL